MRKTFLACLAAAALVVSSQERKQRSVMISHPLTPQSEERELHVPGAGDRRAIERHNLALRQLQQMRERLGRRHIPPLTFGLPPNPPGPPGPPPPPDACVWRHIGPTNIHGRVNDIAIEQSNHDHLFAATVGGLWRSLDRARSWENVSDDFVAGTLGSVAVNPLGSGEVFVGDGDSTCCLFQNHGIGIWRSTSLGAAGTFSKSSPPALDGAVIHRLRIDPAPPNDVYAATSVGVWKGTHSGGSVTWAQVDGFNAWTTDIVLDTSVSPPKIYAGVKEPAGTFTRGVWKWDSASSWKQHNGAINTATSRVIKLAIAKSNPTTLYAYVGDTQAAHLQGIYKTTTGAESNDWAAIPSAAPTIDVPPCSANYEAAIEVDPTDEKIVYAGCASIFRTNGGAVWTDIFAGADPNYDYFVHTDQHAIAFDPSNPKIVYLGHDGGIDRSTDISQAVWHWTDASHGLLIHQLYDVGVVEGAPAFLVGGAQDVGNAVTFGNHSWYNQWWCDGRQVAADAGNVDDVYIDCPVVKLISNPVPGTIGAKTQFNASPATATLPFTADPDQTLKILAAGGNDCVNPATVLKSTDGVNFNTIATAPFAGGAVTALHIVPGSAFQHYYVAFNLCGGGVAQIWRTSNGGGMWDQDGLGIPSGRVMAITSDPASGGTRAFAALAGVPIMTSDGGHQWNAIAGSGATALPGSVALTGIALDPVDPNVVYVSADVGVFKGTISGNDATWEPFDDGLPNGIEVRDIEVNRVAKTLTIGTYAEGAFRRSVSGGTCAPRALVVRDNVLDRGLEPSPSGVPDPEHPIADAAHPGAFKPDDTGAGKLYWWTSSDIRIDVPSADPSKNQIPSADHVEFETCPTHIFDCPAGTMIDSDPQRGKAARAYVQVSNNGNLPVSNVRVIALWTDATTIVPKLPADFWSTTFPAGTTNCGPLSGNAWHLVDPAKPCRVVSTLGPVQPEVVRFDWQVPMSAPEHSCMFVVVDSVDDPIKDSVRNANEREPSVLVPQNRQISQRNLHVIDAQAGPPPPAPPPMHLIAVTVPNPSEVPGIEFALSQSGGRGVKIVVPRDIGDQRLPRVTLTDAERREAERSGIKVGSAYELAGSGELSLPVEAGGQWRIAVIVPPPGRRLVRINVLAQKGRRILGGDIYVIRP